MRVKGYQTLAGLALQHVAGQAGRLGASDLPIPVTFGGWEEATNPYPVYQRADAYRIRAYCLRVFVYKCAYWTGTTWTLPAPSGIFRVVNLGGQTDWGTGRPYETHAWGTGFHRPGSEEANVMTGMLQTDTGNGDFTLSGSRIYALALAQHGDCLPFLIPPGSHHDMVIVGECFKRVAKKYPLVSEDPDVYQAKDVQTANRRLYCHVSACMVAEGVNP
ncbi:MAG: hypothetical protein KBC05_14850 [Candidatus Hydrogenedentes bacterium]|nr:hypothetical protein [Candidatus Hydrogenedentota bacterium]